MTKMKKFTGMLMSVALVATLSCQSLKDETVVDQPVKLITLDPGHFHAALVQKSMYKGVDSVVHVYAPEGPDLDLHLARIQAFNNRTTEPTRWNQIVYRNDDFLDRMVSERRGNVVVISGNNQKKTDYIFRSVEAGLHVLADKPMVIDREDFQQLKKAFALAESKGLLLYDIMTERYEITTILQRELSRMPSIFGTLTTGTRDEPAVTKESVHHFYKHVSGSVLVRPPWFMDVRQQGEGLVDVTTHLVDLIQWECFPDQAIDTADIELIDARQWPTGMRRSQFKMITGLDEFPEYLQEDIRDSILYIDCNGEMNYRLKGVHARVSVIWAFMAPEGGGDTHTSIMRGTKANLVIRQGYDQGFRPALFIEPSDKSRDYEVALIAAFENVAEKFPGVSLKETSSGWEVVIPYSLREGHEAHFAQVTKKFLTYVTGDTMPSWEVPNMIAKYYTTIHALEIAKHEQ